MHRSDRSGTLSGEGTSRAVWGWLLLWLHLMAAIFWVGGQLFLVTVVVPVTRQGLVPADRSRLVGQIGRRFALVSSAALLLLVVTGVLLALRHGISWSLLTGTTWGNVLLVKAAVVGVVLLLTVIHGTCFGRRLEQLAAISKAGSLAWEQRRRLQRQSARLSAVNLALNLLVIALAVWLAVVS